MLAVVACSHDEDIVLIPEQEPSPILFGNPTTGNVEWINGRTDTRATNEISSVIPDDIGVFAFGDGPNTTYIFKNQQVFYKEGKSFKNEGTYKYTWDYEQNTYNETNEKTGEEHNLWPYTTDNSAVVPRYWVAMNYRFFAYSPWFPDANVSVSAENYSGFNSFTWKNVPGFSDKDFVLANEIHPVSVTADELDLSKTPYTVQGDLTKAKVVKFRMRHILSRIRFFFKMSAEYRKIRKIELNSLTVITAGRVKTATFNFNNNEWDETVHWSNEQAGTADPVTLANVEGEEYVIKTEYPADPFTSVYVYPQNDFNALEMELNYTVYDSEGLVTRNARVTNTVKISPAWKLKAGYYYDIKINVVPDYLYVLSDNDQDFDGYVIIKD